MASAKMEVRLSKIEAFVAQQGVVKISDIADHLQVSESTTRRDIEYLIAQKVLIKNYGFVALSNAKTTLYDNPFLRKNINVQVKVALAEKAASLICDGDIIYIESGTTLINMASKITAQNITAVTSDVYIAAELCKHKTITTVSTGGFILGESALMVGDIALNALNNLHFNKCFTSPGGITPDGRITYFNIQASEIRRKVFASSKSIVVLAEKKKFVQNAFVEDLALNDVDVLITDEDPENLPPSLAAHTQIYSIASE